MRPSGEYLMVLPPAQSTSEKKGGKGPEPVPDPAKCVDPCMNQTDDEDECKQCCKDSIPPKEARCLRACDMACSLKL